MPIALVTTVIGDRWFASSLPVGTIELVQTASALSLIPAPQHHTINYAEAQRLLNAKNQAMARIPLCNILPIGGK